MKCCIHVTEHLRRLREVSFHFSSRTLSVLAVLQLLKTMHYALRDIVYRTHPRNDADFIDWFLNFFLILGRGGSTHLWPSIVFTADTERFGIVSSNGVLLVPVVSNFCSSSGAWCFGSALWRRKNSSFDMSLTESARFCVAPYRSNLYQWICAPLKSMNFFPLIWLKQVKSPNILRVWPMTHGLTFLT